LNHTEEERKRRYYEHVHRLETVFGESEVIGCSEAKGGRALHGGLKGGGALYPRVQNITFLFHDTASRSLTPQNASLRNFGRLSVIARFQCGAEERITTVNDQNFGFDSTNAILELHS